MVIGQLDIILTAGNLNNICKFPRSYSPDEEHIAANPVKMMGGEVFELKEMLVYQIGK